MADTDLFFITRGDLESVADAIRSKGGTVADLVYPDGSVTAIGNISGGGGTGHKTGHKEAIKWQNIL